jgi:hypothetical protein
MEFTQSYSHSSSATLAPDGLRLDVATEQRRPPVHLQAMVRESLSYARLMLALYEVVRGDLRSKNKDHSGYQEWVTQRYMEELSPTLAYQQARLPGLLQRRQELSTRVNDLQVEIRRLEASVGGADYRRAKQTYFNWLWKHDKDAWWVLDPVVSVHPDALIFEVFSQDESSYGRVTVPSDRLEVLGSVSYGTTNIDYSRALAREMERVRNYRPAWLQIGAEGVTLATGAGEAVEKKIDLPPSWVRGFLQVQSAAAFGALDVTLSASTLAEVLSVLRRMREAGGPRSLRFRLAPGEFPTLIVEPWGTEIRETEYLFDDNYRGEVRLWGRRRLAVLERVLPHAEKVQVRLLGTGMPSYWSVFLGSHRFDLGLSGWTRNDWARAAQFDLLASTSAVSDRDAAAAARKLEEKLLLTPVELAEDAGLAPRAAAASLQQLCATGQAMYDPVTGAYRWRPLFADPVQLEEPGDRRRAYARKAVEEKRVRWVGRPETVEDRVRHTAVVKGERRERDFDVVLELDADGRVQYAECNCSWHRREKLRQGPCAHILAAAALATQLVTAGTGGPIQAPAAPVLAGKTFVFTGALTRFTREEAHAMVAEAGGKAASDVSRSTDFLIAGERAGSKLTRAREYKIPVLTEEEFLAMLRGR